MKKGFTLIELLVVMAIVAIIGAGIIGIVSHSSGGSRANEDSDYIDWANPEYSRAMSERRQADEMAESNRLKREELELRKKELNNKPERE